MNGFGWAGSSTGTMSPLRITDLLIAVSTVKAVVEVFKESKPGMTKLLRWPSVKSRYDLARRWSSSSMRVPLFLNGVPFREAFTQFRMGVPVSSPNLNCSLVYTNEVISRCGGPLAAGKSPLA